MPQALGLSTGPILATNDSLGVDEIHHAADAAIHVASFVLNLFLLYLVLRYADFKVKDYNKLILATCLGDLTLAIIVLLGEPVSGYPR